MYFGLTFENKSSKWPLKYSIPVLAKMKINIIIEIKKVIAINYHEKDRFFNKSGSLFVDRSWHAMFLAKSSTPVSRQNLFIPLVLV